MRCSSATTLSALLALVGRVAALRNGLAKTPPMGWNNWNAFGCDVSEDLLLTTAERIVALGLRDVGYQYVVLDDCWSDPDRGRDENGKLVPNVKKFPRGMKAVSDDLHSMGLKFGMYSSAGEMTCARYEGSLDHEVQDAQSFASWGVDYLKYDNCYHLGRMGTPQISFNRYKQMADAIKATGRPMVFSLCNWGEDYVHTWGMSLAHSWRMSGDIYDSFSRPDDLCSCTTTSDPFCVAPGTHCSVLFILNRVAPFSDRAQQSGFNDLDMLEVGRGGMTDGEYKAHFAMWAVLRSPLMLGNDVRVVSPEALTILNNPAIIALSQDPLARSAARVRRDVGLAPDEFGAAEAHVWAGPLANGDQVVILLNAAGEDIEMAATLDEIFVGQGPGGTAWQTRSPWAVHDLWATRMDPRTAQKLLEVKSDQEGIRILQDAGWYNATETPYAVGLAKGDERLFGKKVGEVEPKGTLKAVVAKHSANVYRLRRIGDLPEQEVKAKLPYRSEEGAKDEL